MLTSPTPASCEIFCASSVSARFSTSVSGSVAEVTASVRIGASAGLTLA
jgi:microcompartment protein CcmL/EutN